MVPLHFHHDTPRNFKFLRVRVYGSLQRNVRHGTPGGTEWSTVRTTGYTLQRRDNVKDGRNSAGNKELIIAMETFEEDTVKKKFL